MERRKVIIGSIILIWLLALTVINVGGITGASVLSGKEEWTCSNLQCVEVFTKEELHSRYEIYMEQYCKVINIEGRAAVEMVKTQYIPGVIDYTSSLAETIGKIKVINGSSKVQEGIFANVTKYLESAQIKLTALEAALTQAQDESDIEKKAVIYRDSVLTGTVSLRADIDVLETLIPKNYWPVPTYTEMLFLSAN